MTSRNREEDVPIPEIIRDVSGNKTYIKQRFFGKGGFAKCYEIRESVTNSLYAGKIVSKRLLVKSNQKEKMAQEIQIHRNLKHKNIVGFHTYFEDLNFVYIVLELCRKRSMMELHKRRLALTEPEVRYYVRQILDGVSYIHSIHIIHRDLKLGNLFLDDNLVVKIGDFGLAATIEYTGQRKKTLCGTPNYIAPEILKKTGHSFEVDIWSIGCIMYTLLVGKPPFETNSLKETYSRIKRCDYTLPPTMCESAAVMVHKMLNVEPNLRPSAVQLLEMDFMNGYTPKELPASCLTTAPRFDNIREPSRRPLLEINHVVDTNPRKSVIASSGAVRPDNAASAAECDNYLRQLCKQLASLVQSNIRGVDSSNAEEMADPDAQPFVWISKWVDYSDKYGFGYQLCDDGFGVMFNDHTKLVLLANHRNVHYIEKDGSENYYLIGSTPNTIDKKMKLLSYFRKYMTEHLMKAGGSVPIRDSDCFSRAPYLHFWKRSSSSVMMMLSNGTLQFNFTDHSKLILCPLMQAATFIDREKNFRTYRFSTIAANGCTPCLKDALVYASKKVTELMSA